MRKTEDGWRSYVFAIKGKEGDRLLWPSESSKSVKARTAGVTLHIIGVDTAKDAVHRRLGVQQPGPGYCHFPPDRTKEFFDQLAAEKPVRKVVRGRVVKRWVKDPPHARNEALDLRVYATAALAALAQMHGVKLDDHRGKLLERAAELRRAPTTPSTTEAAREGRQKSKSDRRIRGRFTGG